MPGSTGSTVSLAQGITTSLKQEASARDWFRNGSVRRASFASFGIVGRRSATRPRSSRSETSARIWATNGVAARSVSGVARTPGSASRANARSAGNEPFRFVNAGSAARNVFGSSSIARPRAASWAANEPEKTRRLVTRLCSVASLLPSARTTRSRLPIRPLRSPGSVPSTAWLTCEVNLPAGAEVR